jgi:hypothetical protein
MHNYSTITGLTLNTLQANAGRYFLDGPTASVGVGRSLPDLTVAAFEHV